MALKNPFGNGRNVMFEDADEPRQEPKPGSGKKPGRRSRSDLEKQLEEQFLVMLQASALIWSTRDPVCPHALADNSKALAKAFARSASRSRYGAKIAMSISEASVWVPAAQAAGNIALVVYQHHFSPEVRAARNPEPDFEDYAYAGDSPGSVD
jgi:hypothetical protein